MVSLDSLKDFDKFIQGINLRKYPTNEFVGKTNHELLMFIQKQQEIMEEIRTVFGVLQDYSTTMGDIRQARVVLEHWKRFNEFLDKNPDYKEEWDALCMAMRLQES